MLQVTFHPSRTAGQAISGRVVPFVCGAFRGRSNHPLRTLMLSFDISLRFVSLWFQHFYVL